MKEISPKLWIGSQADFEQLDQFGTEWAIVHACKEPHHRLALGYSGRGAPADDPEYLVAERGNRVMLNLIDAHDAKFVHKAMIDAAVKHIETHLAKDAFCMVHCNQGHSRSPTIGMLYLAPDLPEDFDEALAKFRVIYPDHNPATGMLQFARQNWEAYRNRRANQVSEAEREGLDGEIEMPNPEFTGNVPAKRCETCKHWHAEINRWSWGECKDGHVPRGGLQKLTTDLTVCSNWKLRETNG